MMVKLGDEEWGTVDEFEVKLGNEHGGQRMNLRGEIGR
jgi:hypothetical protein